MISIIQHGLKSSELLARRLAAMRSRLGSDMFASLGLDAGSRTFEAGQHIFESGRVRNEVQVMVSGVVGEVRILSDGRRQILALRLPGYTLIPNSAEALVALTLVRVADGLPLMACLANSSEDYQPLRRAWIAASRTDQAILRDQVVRLGRMSAFERVAHMVLEAHERLAQVGLATETTFHMPLTQEVISDVIGLSVVHLNRTLQTLRRSALVASRQGYFTLVDRPRLLDIAGYVSRFPVAWRPGEAHNRRILPSTFAMAG